MPAWTREPIGASSSPPRFFEIAPVGKTFTHAVSPARSLIHAIVLGLSAAGEVIKTGHAHSEAVGDLIKNDALQPVSDAAVDLDATVDRARMHDQAIRFQKLRALFR